MVKLSDILPAKNKYEVEPWVIAFLLQSIDSVSDAVPDFNYAMLPRCLAHKYRYEPYVISEVVLGIEYFIEHWSDFDDETYDDPVINVCMAPTANHNYYTLTIDLSHSMFAFPSARLLVPISRNEDKTTSYLKFLHTFQCLQHVLDVVLKLIVMLPRADVNSQYKIRNVLNYNEVLENYEKTKAN